MPRETVEDGFDIRGCPGVAVESRSQGLGSMRRWRGQGFASPVAAAYPAEMASLAR